MAFSSSAGADPCHFSRQVPPCPQRSEMERHPSSRQGSHKLFSPAKCSLAQYRTEPKTSLPSLHLTTDFPREFSCCLFGIAVCDHSLHREAVMRMSKWAVPQPRLQLVKNTVMTEAGRCKESLVRPEAHILPALPPGAISLNTLMCPQPQTWSWWFLVDPQSTCLLARADLGTIMEEAI